MDLAAYTKEHGQSQLARRLGVTQGLVWQWVTKRRQVAAEQCIAIEAATEGVVTAEELRPDVDWSVIRGSPAPEPAP